MGSLVLENLLICIKAYFLMDVTKITHAVSWSFASNTSGRPAREGVLPNFMTVLSEQSSVLFTDYALPAWSIFLLGIALIVGLSNKRRASILVDLFILALVGAHIVQILIATYQPGYYKNFILLFAFIPM
jgi:hypothetical protein